MLNLKEELKLRIVADNESATPVFFRIASPEDRKALSALLISNAAIKVLDKIELQLADLVKLMNPSKNLSKQESDELVTTHLTGCPIEEYGVWVYYPWKNALVHLLDEEEFIRVRTVRNLYKILPEEQALLRTKKIGVIGLSVGQSVALAIAMERICGELRIADMDTVELSNLNRIRTPVTNLGVKKTVMVAREIAELDPFIKLVCCQEGITKENFEAFLIENGKLDIVVEECDDVAIKILVRQQCKKMSIPVVMDTSDRGLVDIERYDIEPDYPLLHGLIDESISFDFLRTLKTSEEKLPYLVPFAGIDTLSTRIKSSALEIGQSITSWPQLASEVILGGAIVANVCRKILLGHNIKSTRKWIDLDKHFMAETHEIDSFNFIQEPELEFPDAISLIEGESNFEGGLDPGTAILQELLDKAMLAPSPGNNQRWKWVWNRNALFVFLDKTKNSSVGDNDGIATTIGIGAAIENLTIWAATKKLKAIVSMYHKENFPLVARIHFETLYADDQRDMSLANAIDQRCTNRSLGAYSKISVTEMETLQSTFSDNSSALITIIDTLEGIQKLGSMIREADKVRLLNQQAHTEFYRQELRWLENESIRDGVVINQIELTEQDKVGLRIASDYDAVDVVKKLGGGQALLRISKAAIDQSSSLAVISTPELTNQNVLVCGRHLERLWLTATTMNIGIQPMTYLFMLMNLAENDAHKFLSEKEHRAIGALRQQFHSMFPELSGLKQVFLFRIHKNPNKLARSKRFKLNEKTLLT